MSRESCRGTSASHCMVKTYIGVLYFVQDTSLQHRNTGRYDMCMSTFVITKPPHVHITERQTRNPCDKGRCCRRSSQVFNADNRTFRERAASSFCLLHRGQTEQESHLQNHKRLRLPQSLMTSHVQRRDSPPNPTPKPWPAKFRVMVDSVPSIAREDDALLRTQGVGRNERGRARTVEGDRGIGVGRGNPSSLLSFESCGTPGGLASKLTQSA